MKDVKIVVKVPEGLADIVKKLAKAQGVNEKRLGGYLLDQGLRAVTARQAEKDKEE